MFLLALGASYEAFMAAGDADRYPARGQLVDIGGYQLHISCVGEGSPTVVLDPPRRISLDWSLVQPELRPQPVSARTTARAMAGAIRVLTPGHRAKLSTNSSLAGRCGHPRPLCVGGALGGGQAMRLYANGYPQDVVGMVLIDARHESVDTNRSPEALATEHKQQQRFQRMIWAAARVGLVRAFWAAAWPQVFPTTQNLSTETRAEIGVLQARSHQVKTVLREDALLTHDNAKLSSATSLGSLPLIVLAAGQNVEPTRSGYQRSRSWPASRRTRNSSWSTAVVTASIGISRHW